MSDQKPKDFIGVKKGVWQKNFELLSEDADKEYTMIDSTIVRAHPHSAGAKKKAQKKTKPSGGLKEA